MGLFTIYGNDDAAARLNLARELLDDLVTKTTAVFLCLFFLCLSFSTCPEDPSLSFLSHEIPYAHILGCRNPF